MVLVSVDLNFKFVYSQRKTFDATDGLCGILTLQSRSLDFIASKAFLSFVLVSLFSDFPGRGRMSPLVFFFHASYHVVLGDYRSFFDFSKDLPVVRSMWFSEV